MQNQYHSIEMQRTADTFICYLGLYSASLADLESTRAEYLSPQELAEYHCIKHSKRQHSYLLGRKCAKDLLHKFFGLNVKNSSITNGIFGQPLLQSAELQQYGLSISHCNATAVVIIFPSAHPMGIDLEDLLPGKSQVVTQYITAQESALVAHNAAIPHLPLVIWSAREAASKVLLCGIGVPKHLFEVKSIAPHNESYTLRFENFFHIKGHAFILNSQYVVSVALPSNTDFKFNI